MGAGRACLLFGPSSHCQLRHGGTLRVQSWQEAVPTGGLGRYAGLYWTKPEKYDKLDAKGIETVRRDNCQLASNLIDT